MFEGAPRFSSNNMRGLSVFISDLRNCRSKEAEEKRVNKELANIRAKFRAGNLSGYDRKKYVCKLMYMFIIGYELDFGQVEAVNLTSGTKFSEKQLGYLAVTLLLSEDNDLLRLVNNQLRKDLEDPNEIFNCLALTTTANIAGAEMAENLLPFISRHLSPSSTPFIKKKAALCLLHMYQKNPDLVQAKDWAPTLIRLIDDDHPGVCLSVCNLISGLIEKYPQEYSSLVPKAINKLQKLVIERSVRSEYIYYKIPIPWLQIRLFRLLQVYSPIENESQRKQLEAILFNIVTTANDTPKNHSQVNSTNAVLFEAINLAFHTDINSSVVGHIILLLSQFLTAKDTNTRYLTLEAMTTYVNIAENLEPIKRALETILSTLKDKDISIRRRGLDLLYSMCDTNNSKQIVGELLKFLVVADYSIREEMTLKTAILAEKFAPDFSWYVDVILQLIAIAGDYVNDEIWFRVVHIITNNDEKLQRYACLKILDTIRDSSCHENAVKIAGYVLGEFGHFIANENGANPLQQFQILQSRFASGSKSTRALLMTTFLKFTNMFPEIKTTIVKLFDDQRFLLDVELQQRAIEYFAITRLQTDDILRVVCDEMPEFPERESAVLARLQKKHPSGSKDKTVLHKVSAKAFVEAKSTSTENKNLKSLAGLPPVSSNQPSVLPARSSSLGAGTQLVSTPKIIEIPDAVSTILGGKQGGGFLFENEFLQIGLQSVYTKGSGVLTFFFINKSQSITLDSMSMLIENVPEIEIESTQPLPTLILPAAHVSQVWQIRCYKFFSKSPKFTIKLTVNQTQPYEIRGRLPVTLLSFSEPITMGGPEFFARWQQIGGPPKETVSEFRSMRLGETTTGVPWNRFELTSILHGLNLAALEGIDPNPSAYVVMGIIHTADAPTDINAAKFLGLQPGHPGPKAGILARIETNINNQDTIRLTIRATDPLVSNYCQDVIQMRLGKH